MWTIEIDSEFLQEKQIYYQEQRVAQIQIPKTESPIILAHMSRGGRFTSLSKATCKGKGLSLQGKLGSYHQETQYWGLDLLHEHSEKFPNQVYSAGTLYVKLIKDNYVC